MSVPRITADAICHRSVNVGGQSLPIGTFPFIVTDIVTEWPAFRQWTADALIARHGGSTVACFAGDRRDPSFLQQVNKRRKMSFGAFVRHVFGGESDELLYLRIGADEPLFRELGGAFRIPSILPNYNPDATGIWIGQAPNVTTFHHDWWHSCLAQVRGRKRFILVHPFEAGRLQADWSDAARFDLAAAPYVSPQDPALAGLETAVVGTLEPGEMLYIPPFWWHQVETIDGGNISMPIRFDTTQSPDVPLFQLSQDSSLREITNQPVVDAARLKACLAGNRKRFRRREEGFLHGIESTRRVRIDPDDFEELRRNSHTAPGDRPASRH